MPFNDFDIEIQDNRVQIKKNTLVTIKTTIGISKEKINLPEQCQSFKLVYTSASRLWIGPEEEVGVDGDASFPVLADIYFMFDLKKGNDNDLWGVSSSGDIDVYVIGSCKV